MIVGVTSHAHKNNVANLVDGSGIVVTTIQAIERTFQMFTFEMTVDSASAVEKAFRGNWRKVWKSGTAYLTGDTVFFSGDYYRATSNSTGSLPSTEIDWITLVPLTLPYDADWGSGFGVALETRADPGPPYTSPSVDDCPLSVEWSIPDDYYDTYPEGTVRETWRSYGQVLRVREEIDPGYNPFAVSSGTRTVTAQEQAVRGNWRKTWNSMTSYAIGDTVLYFGDYYIATNPSTGSMPSTEVNFLTLVDITESFYEIINSAAEPRPGPRYTFQSFGNELAAYQDWKQGKEPIVKVSMGEGGVPYPMRLTTRTPGADCFNRNIVFAGDLPPSTILSDRDQIAAFPDHALQTEFHMRMRQVSKYPGLKGIPLDLTVTVP